MSRYLTDPSEGKERGFFWEMPDDPDHAVTVFANQEGGVTIAVAEERAVDSYNASFELDIALPRKEALRLRDYLVKNL